MMLYNLYIVYAVDLYEVYRKHCPAAIFTKDSFEAETQPLHL